MVVHLVAAKRGELESRAFFIQWISSRKRRFATWKNRIGDFGGLPDLLATFRAWILWTPKPPQ